MQDHEYLHLSQPSGIKRRSLTIDRKVPFIAVDYSDDGVLVCSVAVFKNLFGHSERLDYSDSGAGHLFTFDEETTLPLGAFGLNIFHRPGILMGLDHLFEDNQNFIPENSLQF